MIIVENSLPPLHLSIPVFSQIPPLLNGFFIFPEGERQNLLGVMWQLLYLAPHKETIIVRFGKKWGHVDWWPFVLKNIVDKL